jgi:hypothetical protein
MQTDKLARHTSSCTCSHTVCIYKNHVIVLVMCSFTLNLEKISLYLYVCFVVCSLREKEKRRKGENHDNEPVLLLLMSGDGV